MREINFRGKKEILTEENKKYTEGWIYSDTLYKDDNGVYLIPFGVSAEAYHLGSYDFRANSDRFEIMVAKIKPETLGQYSEMKDRKGNKIFEGDIVKYCIHVKGCEHLDKIYIIEYSFGGFRLREDLYDEFSDYIDNDSVDWDRCEIIGNIYDNPELLKRSNYANNESR